MVAFCSLCLPLGYAVGSCILFSVSGSKIMRSCFWSDVCVVLCILFPAFVLWPARICHFTRYFHAAFESFLFWIARNFQDAILCVFDDHFSS